MTILSLTRLQETGRKRKKEPVCAPTLAAHSSRKISEVAHSLASENVASAERQATPDPRLILRSPHHTAPLDSSRAMRGAQKKSRGFSLARRRCCRAVQCRVLQPVLGAPRQRSHLKRARSTDIEAAADPAGSLELWPHLASGDMLPRVRFLRGPTSPEDGDPTSPDSWNQPTTIKSCMSSCSTTSENRRWPEADSSKYTAPITSLVYSVVCCGLVGEG